MTRTLQTCSPKKFKRFRHQPKYSVVDGAACWGKGMAARYFWETRLSFAEVTA